MIMMIGNIIIVHGNIWAQKLLRKRAWQIRFPNFFACSVTPCTVYAYHDNATRVYINYLAHIIIYNYFEYNE